MNILITGGSGFIGQSFIRRFPQYQYTILTRNKVKAQLINPSCTCIDSLSDLNELNTIDAVINLAGEPIVDKRWSQNQKHIIQHSRWDITEQLVNLINASQTPPSVFISGSAIGYYGNSNVNSDGTEQAMTENSPCAAPDFSSDLCQKWEAIAQQAQDSTRVLYLRTAVVLGAKHGALNKMLLPFKLGLGAKLGSGQQMMSWIHIDDAVNAIHALLLNPNCVGPYNLTAPHPVTNTEFTQTLAHTLNSKAFLMMPEKLLRLAMGESADLLLNSQMIIPEKFLAMGFEFKHPELKGALTDLLK